MISWLRRLYIAIMDRHDPAAVMQTWHKPAQRYDEAKAVASWKRSQRQTETGRAIKRPKAKRSTEQTRLRAVK